MKRLKNVRQRASKTHGWGAMKKHRGAGNRGGRGNAGSGKRGDQKKPSYWNDKKPVGSKKYGKSYFGKHGFSSVWSKSPRGINVQDIERQLGSWAKDKKATKSADTYSIDLSKLGFHKLLGTGKVTQKLKITVLKATPSAIEKVNAAGGSVTVTDVAEEVAAE